MERDSAVVHRRHPGASMPRASHQLIHEALFGTSHPLPPRLKLVCGSQLAVGGALFLFAAHSALREQPMVGDPNALMGVVAGYALSVLAAARSRGLYIRLMVIWSLLSFGVSISLLRAFGRAETRQRVGPVHLLAPCILHITSVLLNVYGISAALSGGGRAQQLLTRHRDATGRTRRQPLVKVA